MNLGRVLSKIGCLFEHFEGVKNYLKLQIQKLLNFK